MNIIEKLGIEPIDSHNFDQYFDEGEGWEVEQQNAEMLEALIEDTMSVEEVFVDMPNLPFKAEHREKHKSRIRLIEKVADKTWQEIKELF